MDTVCAWHHVSHDFAEVVILEGRAATACCKHALSTLAVFLAATSGEALMKTRLSSWYMYVHVPSIIKDQGDNAKELSAKWRAGWITNVNCKDWVLSKHSRVCSEHSYLVSSLKLPLYQFLLIFVGRPVLMYDTDNPLKSNSEKLKFYTGVWVQEYVDIVDILS